MTSEEAKDFLTHYICCCPYGTSPTNCGDDKCEFGMAIKTLCDNNERPKGKKDIRKPYGWQFCSECGKVLEPQDNFCWFCGADLRGNEI